MRAALKENGCSGIKFGDSNKNSNSKAGRSGQASLTEILRRHVPVCYAAFEEPNIKKKFPTVAWPRRHWNITNRMIGFFLICVAAFLFYGTI